MAAFVTFKLIGHGKTVKKFKKVGESLILKELRIVMKEIFDTEIRTDAIENVKSKLNKARGSGRGLSQNITTKVKILGKVVIGIIGVRDKIPYGAIHEFGGIITPKKGKYLTIPFPGIKGKARDFANTFVAKSRNNNLIIFQNLGKTKTGRQKTTARKVRDIRTRKGFTIRPLFSLKTSVTIPKRPYLRPALITNIPLLKKEIKKRLNELA